MLYKREDQGLPAPALDKKPELYPWLEFYWKAFTLLSNRRSYIPTGTGALPAPISFQDICLYADKYRLYNEADFEQFLELIDFLDGLYLKDRAEKAKEAAKTAKQQQGAGDGRLRGKRRN